MDENSGHYVIASSWPPERQLLERQPLERQPLERQPLERRTLVPILVILERCHPH